MANTTSQIKLIFDGSARGVVAAAAEAKSAIRGLNDENSKLAKIGDKAGAAILNVGKGIAALGAAGSAVQVVGGVAGALVQLAPAALLLPGALGAGAAAMTTFKIATAGFGDAIKAGLSGDMEKFAKDTKDMAPAMQDAAKAVVAFKPQLDDLKKTVQGNFWSQFSGDIKGLGDTLLPTFKAGLGDIATQMGVVTKGAIQAAQTPFFKGSINSILQSTAGFFREVGTAAGDVLTGIVGIGKVGATYLPQLGELIGGVAQKFKDWVTSVQGQNQIKTLIDGAIQGFKDLGAIAVNIGSILGSVFTGLGGQISSPLASLRELTGQLAAFLKTAEAQDALRSLGEVLSTCATVMRDVLMAALKQVAPLVKDLSPAAIEAAKGFGDFLVGAINTVGPLLRDLAQFLSANKDAIRDLTPVILGAVAAIKLLKIGLEVKGWIDGATAALRGFSGAAEAAGAEAGASWVKGLKGGLTLVGVGVGATIILDKILPRDAAATHGSQVARDMLSQMAAVFSGDEGNIFRQWDVAKWITNPLQAAVDLGRKTLESLFNINPPPIPVEANTDPATGAVNTWVDTTGNTVATSQMDANTVRATDKVSGWKTVTSATVGVAQLDANPAAGNAKIAGWKGTATATTGVTTLDSNPAPANQKIAGWKGSASATTGVTTLDSNRAPADAKLSGWRGTANATTGVAKLDANRAPADGQTNGWRNTANATTATAHLNAESSAARSVLQAFYDSWAGRIITWTVRILGGLAGGGPVPGRAGGGPIYGPGTGTSDTAGLFALSRGEHVLTAREVQAAGGHAAIFRLRQALAAGRVPRMAANQGRAASGGAIVSNAALALPTPHVTVNVQIGDRSLNDMIDTRISHSSRQTRRTVGMGAGTTF